MSLFRNNTSRYDWTRKRLQTVRVSWCRLISRGALLLTVAAFPAIGQDDILSNLLRQHHYTEALKTATDQLRIHPDDSFLWLYRGLAERGLDQTKPSLESIRHALQLNPANTQAAEAGAQISYTAHDASAGYYVDQVLRLEPSSQPAHAMAGVLALEKPDCPAAIEHLKQAGELASHDLSLKRRLASCLSQQGDLTGAVNLMTELHTLAPSDRDINLQLALLDFTTSRFTETIALLKPLRASLDSNGLGLLADAYAGMDDTINAVDAYRAAIELVPTDDRFYLDLAVLSMDHQSPEVALGVLNAGIAKIPASPRLLVLRGTVYAQTGKNDLAQTDFERADRLDPHSIFGTLGLGVLLREESNLDQAQSVLETKLARSPHDAVLNFMLADTLVRKGADPGDSAFADAVVLLQESLKREPNLAQSHALLGKLLLKQGRTEDAVVQLEAAVHLKGTDRTALNQLLTAYRRLGRTADADRTSAILAQAVSSDRAQETARNRTHLTLDPAPGSKDGAPKNP